MNTAQLTCFGVQCLIELILYCAMHLDAVSVSVHSDVETSREDEMPRKSTGRVIRKRQSRRAVAGSERFQPFDAKTIGAVDPKHTVTLSIYVRPRIAEGRIPTVHAFNGGSEPWATAQDRQKMLQAFDADPKDLDRVRAFAKANKLRERFLALTIVQSGNAIAKHPVGVCQNSQRKPALFCRLILRDSTTFRMVSMDRVR